MFLVILSFLPFCLTLNCGPLNPEIVWGSQLDSVHNLLTLGEDSWMAENGKTSGQGFIMELGSCEQTIAGIRIQNPNGPMAGTKKFRISGSLSQQGPWRETLLQEEMEDGRWLSKNPSPIITFYFTLPVTVQFLRFELVEFFGIGGGLQYFSPVGREERLKKSKSHS